ncbi:MAG TPA: thiamine pyrophosphate-binding protein, partial [Acidimicrobiales bacterium]|nr:thiamine pyrophosphate-binding protein [Acidimicrobiales bacterium]
MNGADALLATLRANDVTTIFTNPGTTEIHLVAALDHVPEVQGVLCLFEGVATGAADGYARVTGRAAATLLHLGPGLANGWANLHNARRARTPILNIIGDHPDFHRLLDPPLNSNVAALAGALEGWHHRFTGPNDVAAGTAAALAAAYGPPGQIATLILGSDVAWDEVSDATGAWPVAPHRAAAPPSSDEIARSLTSLRTKRTALFVGGAAATAEQLALAQRIAGATSARVIMETFPAIFDHGAGVGCPERLIYLSDFAAAQLRDLDTIILIGTTIPVPPFAYQAGPNS